MQSHIFSRSPTIFFLILSTLYLTLHPGQLKVAWAGRSSCRKHTISRRIYASSTLTTLHDGEVVNPHKARELVNADELESFPSTSPNDVISSSETRPSPESTTPTVVRKAHNDVYLWPTLSEQEQRLIRDAFHQIHRRSCIRFNEMEYKPWYHAERWREDKPHVVIRKSGRFAGYTDNVVEGTAKRSLIYISKDALLGASHMEKELLPAQRAWNNSRGAVMDQLLRFMGYREELLRPDAYLYIQPSAEALASPTSLASHYYSRLQDDQQQSAQLFASEQLKWPFDPESVTVPARASGEFRLTANCPARREGDIGAGQRVGLLTRWDAVKLNSMYCPTEVGYADPAQGACVVPRRARSNGKK